MIAFPLFQSMLRDIAFPNKKYLKLLLGFNIVALQLVLDCIESGGNVKCVADEGAEILLAAHGRVSAQFANL